MNKAINLFCLLSLLVIMMVSVVATTFSDEGAGSCYSSAKNNADNWNCAVQEIEQLTKVQNNLEHQVQAKLNSQQKALFKASQETWEEFKNLNCEFESAPFMYGNISKNLSLGCRQSMYQARNVQLQLYNKLLTENAHPARNMETPAEEGLLKALAQMENYLKAKDQGNSFLHLEDKGKDLKLLKNAQQAWKSYQNQVCLFERKLFINENCPTLGDARARQLEKQLDIRKTFDWNPQAVH